MQLGTCLFRLWEKGWGGARDYFVIGENRFHRLFADLKMASGGLLGTFRKITVQIFFQRIKWTQELGRESSLPLLNGRGRICGHEPSGARRRLARHDVVSDEASEFKPPRKRMRFAEDKVAGSAIRRSYDGGQISFISETLYGVRRQADKLEQCLVGQRFRRV